MSKKINVGIIGCGNIASVYAAYLNKEQQLNIAGCCDKDYNKAAKLASKYNTGVYSLNDILAEKEIDLLINLTSPEYHYDINMLILDSGHHLFCEKPMAMTHDKATGLVNTAMDNQLYIGCAPDTFLGLEIANKGWKKAVEQNQALAKGVTLLEGCVTCEGVASAHGFDYAPLQNLLA